jgi:hypothetical protein
VAWPNFNAILELGGHTSGYPIPGPFFAGEVGPCCSFTAPCRVVKDTGVVRTFGLEIVVDRETMNSAGSYIFPIIRDTVVQARPALIWFVEVIDTAHVAFKPLLDSLAYGTPPGPVDMPSFRKHCGLQP